MQQTIQKGGDGRGAPLRWEMVSEGDATVRHVTELRLWEVSLVSWGADPEARVLSVASRAAMTFDQQRQYVEDQFRAIESAGLSDAKLHAMRADVERQLRTYRR